MGSTPQPIAVAKKGVSKEVRNKIQEVRSLKTNEIGRSWNKSMVQSRNNSLTHDQGTYVFLKPERNVSWKSYAELWEFVNSQKLWRSPSHCVGFEGTPVDLQVSLKQGSWTQLVFLGYA